MAVILPASRNESSAPPGQCKREIPVRHEEATMKNLRSKVVLVVFMVLTCSAMLFAQSDLGRISGFIKDPSGATVPNAKVTVRNNIGVERQVTTNESGYYVEIGRASCRERV